MSSLAPCLFIVVLQLLLLSLHLPEQQMRDLCSLLKQLHITTAVVVVTPCVPLLLSLLIVVVAAVVAADYCGDDNVGIITLSPAWCCSLVPTSVTRPPQLTSVTPTGTMTLHAHAHAHPPADDSAIHLQTHRSRIIDCYVTPDCYPNTLSVAYIRLDKTTGEANYNHWQTI